MLGLMWVRKGGVPNPSTQRGQPLAGWSGRARWADCTDTYRPLSLSCGARDWTPAGPCRRSGSTMGSSCCKSKAKAGGSVAENPAFGAGAPPIGRDRFGSTYTPNDEETLAQGAAVFPHAFGPLGISPDVKLQLKASESGRKRISKREHQPNNGPRCVSPAPPPTSCLPAACSCSPA